jgi:hypothetical protein
MKYVIEKDTRLNIVNYNPVFERYIGDPETDHIKNRN